ncbi:hypothetical protein ETI10_03105 [Macrococcoides goetzii]|nr:hypothetical protein [Macrococcus goetzii]TDM42095.1 hypothetical protein ETI10_03105 [Macrococcus goetzii]
MYKDIFISIHPKYTKKIEFKEKRYELRNFKTKYPIKRFYIYESMPVCKLTYIANVELPIIFPDKIKNSCIESERFNNGETLYKKAYEIKDLYKLEEPLPLHKLKEDYQFTAPQNYTYSERYPDLINKISNMKLIKIF